MDHHDQRGRIGHTVGRKQCLMNSRSMRIINQPSERGQVLVCLVIGQWCQTFLLDLSVRLFRQTFLLDFSIRLFYQTVLVDCSIGLFYQQTLAGNISLVLLLICPDGFFAFSPAKHTGEHTGQPTGDHTDKTGDRLTSISGGTPAQAALHHQSERLSSLKIVKSSESLIS